MNSKQSIGNKWFNATLPIITQMNHLPEQKQIEIVL